MFVTAVDSGSRRSPMSRVRQRGLQAEAYRDYLRVKDGQSMRRALDKQMEKEHRKEMQ